MTYLALLLLLLLPPFTSACWNVDVENFMRQKEGINWETTTRRYYPGVWPKSLRELFSAAAEFLELSSNELGVEVEFACVNVKFDYDDSNPLMAREDSYAWPKYDELDGRPLKYRLTTKEFTRNFTQSLADELNIARAEWMDRVIVYVRQPTQEKELDSIFFEITMKSTPRHPADPNSLEKDIKAVANRAYKAALNAQRRSTTASTTEPTTTTFFSMPPHTTLQPRTMPTIFIIFTNAKLFISVVIIMSIVLLGFLVKRQIYNKKKTDVVEMTNFAILKNGHV